LVGRQVVVEGEVWTADSVVFNFVCEQIEGLTTLDRLESRGTVRSALKTAVLEARTVTADQMGVVVKRVLVSELVKRGIDRAEAHCLTIDQQLATLVVGISSSEKTQAVCLLRTTP
jgi:hypothetical protein